MRAVPLAIAAALLFSGCAGSQPSPDIMASFYPIEYIVSQLVGEGVSVESVVPPGIEPHEWEPTPADIERAGGAKVFVVMAPEVHHSPDAWAHDLLHDFEDRGVHIVEAATASDLSLTWVPDEEEGHEGEEEEHDEHEGEEHMEGGPEPDPHIWLDPRKMKDLTTKIEAGLAAYDPSNATAYKSRADALRADFDRLDQTYRTTLQNCAKHDIITAHAAFGYLAAAYGFNQHGISGLSPEVEPSPAQIQELVDLARQLQVRYIFFETLVSRNVAEVIAQEVGAKTLPLNPIEGLTEKEKREGFHDYDTLMRENLDNLFQALECH